MSKRYGIGSALLAMASFAGGVSLGMLLAPKSGKESRKWINDQATEMADWVDEQSRQTLSKGSRQIDGLRKNVRNGLKQNLPDLYEATEHIELDGSDLIDG